MEYVLETPQVFTTHYEVAAWHTKVEVPAGRYPARYVTIDGRETSEEHAYYVAVSLPGVIVSSYTPSLFAGNLIRGDVNPQNEHHPDVGTPRTVHLRPYAYSVKPGTVINGGTFA